MWRRQDSNLSVDLEAYDIVGGLSESKGKQQIAKF